MKVRRVLEVERFASGFVWISLIVKTHCGLWVREVCARISGSVWQIGWLVRVVFWSSDSDWFFALIGNGALEERCGGEVWGVVCVEHTDGSGGGSEVRGNIRCVGGCFCVVLVIDLDMVDISFLWSLLLSFLLLILQEGQIKLNLSLLLYWLYHLTLYFDKIVKTLQENLWVYKKRFYSNSVGNRNHLIQKDSTRSIQYGGTRIYWPWRRSRRRSVFVSRVRSRSVFMTRVTSLRWSLRRYLRRATWTGMFFIGIISWSSVFWRSSVSVIVITVSRCKAIPVLWSVVFVCIIFVSWTSISISIFISIWSIIERITKVLYKRFLSELWCSIGFSFIFVVSLFLETCWDRVICSVTKETRFYVGAFLKKTLTIAVNFLL